MEGGPRGRRAASTALLAALVTTLLAGTPSASAEPSQEYSVSELCKHRFRQTLNHVIDGATLHSKNERNLDCKLTFQTETVLQRFMVRFDYLQLDCNDHLYIHDGAHAIDGKYKADLSCRNTKESVGTLYTRSNHLTLEYKTDAWGTSKNGFRMVITAFKHVTKDMVACDQFLCDDHCISSDLLCDGVVHCLHGGDESVIAGCVDAGLGTMFGLDQTMFLGAAAGVAGVIIIVVISVIVCLCRRRRRRQRHPNNGTVNNTYQMASVNYSGSNGTRAGTEKQPFSENWLHPAVWTGFPLSAHCSPSRSKRRGQTATPPARRMSGSCEGWRRRRGARSADPSRPAQESAVAAAVAAADRLAGWARFLVI
ncbi:uncharacterized protein LOC122389713 [Amphibalanus amphitrite]|uniref:uncharacterized protein LOC122389713 n=1 Tax=Amphibalanus amphitrite TaxID=1232801 RepID=UPI001C9158F0|nr:uncharacterized protein LOC122389713 [Amphibalanus amphitrite]